MIFHNRFSLFTSATEKILLLAVLTFPFAPTIFSQQELLKDVKTTGADFSRIVSEKLGQKLGKTPLFVARRYIQTYPEFIHGVKVDQKRASFLLVGSKKENAKWIPLEDGILQKDHETMLNTCDLVETLHQGYPIGLPFDKWPENLDPGRFRNSEFLKAVYGGGPDEVTANLVTIDFAGRKFSFNNRNGAAAAFERVSKKLNGLIAEKPKYKPFFSKMGGAFNWRNIAGTNRLSAHSFGVTVDLNPALGGYWKWGDQSDLDQMERRVNYPEEIVKIFESERIIWGGKWYHYDLMHFEYRPELFGGNPPKHRRNSVQPPEKNKPIVIPEKPDDAPVEAPEKQGLLKKIFKKKK